MDADTHWLMKKFDARKDSLCFYVLGNSYKSKVEHYGIKPSIDMTDPLII
jgi:CRISPR-associated protein Cas2